MADYRIDLGIGLRSQDFTKLQNKIKSLEDNPIKLKIDGSAVDAEIKGIRSELASLGKTKGLKFDTSALETSLSGIKTDITEIKNLLSSFGNGANTKGIVSSINNIGTALDRVSKQFIELNTRLNGLSGKNFGVNIGLNIGSGNAVSRNAAYGMTARGEIIPQLQQQAAALETYLARYYKVADGFNAVQKLIQGTGVVTGSNHPITLLPQMTDGSNLSKQMTALKQYIALIKEAAAVKGVDLTSVTSGFTQSADQLVTKAKNVQSGTDQMEESLKKLQGLFNSGINAEKLSAQLDSIVADLSEIKVVLQGLTQNVSIEGLTQSFNNLSASLERLVGNATQAQNALNNGLNTSGASDGTQRAIQKQEQLAQTTTQTANTVTQSGQKIQQAFNQIASAGKLDPLQLHDDITEADRFSAALSKLKNIQSNIGRIDVGKISTSKSVQELKVLETQLESLSAEYNETVAEINGMGGVSATQMQSFQNQITTTKLKIEELKASISSGIKSNFGNYENQLLSLEGRIGKLTTKTPELQMGLERVKQALSALQFADGTENLVVKNQQYLSILKRVESQVKKLEIAERNADSDVALKQQKQALALKMSNWLRDNSAAAKQFSGDIRNLQVQLKNCGNMSGLRQIGRDFQNVTLKAKEAGLTALSFGDRLKKQFAQYSSYISVYSLFMYTTQALRSMFEQVKSIDSAMTELKKVTNETNASYNKFLENATSRAKAIGATIDGLVTSTADFARLGYGFKDAQGLAEVANIYAVVGDEIDSVETASQSLISTMAAFKDEMNGLSDSDFALSIVDKFNEVSNNFSISSGGIGEALTRSASSLAAANNTLDESIALITAANTVVQDPTTVGTAFKTISMRIRGAKTELEDAGLETEGMVESTAKLREEIMALSGVDIMASATEFKSTYQILDELADKWQDLTDIQQASVTELIAGKIYQYVQKYA